MARSRNLTFLARGLLNSMHLLHIAERRRSCEYRSIWYRCCGARVLFLEKIAPRARMAFLEEIPMILHETISIYYVLPVHYDYE
jgi:hypothetical protein